MITIKNYKKLEGTDLLPWRDFVIQTITEEEKYYQFKVLYNRIPYTICLQRENAHGANSKQHHWVKLFDANKIFGYANRTITKEVIRNKEKMAEEFYNLIDEVVPKAQPVTGRNFNNNNPF